MQSERLSDIHDEYPYYKREKLQTVPVPEYKFDTRVIILGSNGMLGRYMFRVFTESGVYDNGYVVGLTRSDFDFGQSSEIVSDYLLDLIGKNDLVINCIGMTNKRPQTTDSEELQFWRVNTVLPRLLAHAVCKKRAYLVHITTDCVFDGKEGWMCREDLHTSVDLYGLSKSLGDYGIKNYPMVATLRCSIIGEEENKRSLIEWVLDSEPGSTIDGYTNHKWNGVTCLQLSKIVLNCMKVPESTSPGKCDYVDHFFFGKEVIIKSNLVSKYELVKTIAEVYGVDVKVAPVAAAVPKNMQLSAVMSNKLSIKDQIVEMKELDVLKRRSSNKI